jgi:GTP 3',8-cyclase
MPIGADAWDRAQLVPATEILELIEAAVGIIASVTRPFCQHCNRLRLTADGKLRNCLFSNDETDVRSLLRPAFDPAGFEAAVRSCLRAKGPGHEITLSTFRKPLRTMHAIGG